VTLAERIAAMLPPALRERPRLSDAEIDAREAARGLRNRRARGAKPRLSCPCGIPGHYLVGCPTKGIPPEP
jgi:hypothetical protein